MFEQVSAQLEELIVALEIPATGDALRTASELLDLFTARFLDAVGELDAVEGWRDEGATSMTAWLRHETRRSSNDASRCRRTARRLRALPVTAAAYRDGSLSGGQVQAIMANLNDTTTPLFAEAEGELVPLLVALSVRDVASVMQAWAQAAKDELQEDSPDETPLPERDLHLSRTLDGRGELSGSLDPEARALVDCALRQATTDNTDGEPTRTAAHRRADALVEICRFFLTHQNAEPATRHRPHLNVFVDYEDLLREAKGGWLDDGTRLDAATVRKLACDAGVHRIVTEGRSSILDYGHKHQSIPVNLFNALIARDRHCRFPGCDRPPNWCEGHHVKHWAHHGPTALANLWAS